MKTSNIALAILLLLVFSSGAMAHSNKHRSDHHKHARFAKVVAVKPVYETVRVRVPHRECRDYPRRRSHVSIEHNHSPERILIGGIVGGIIGHEFSAPGHKEFGTVAGALIGSTIAHDTAPGSYRMEYDYDRHTSCRHVDRYTTERRIKGYKVKYRYRGEIYKTRTRVHPGKRIKIREGYGRRHRF